jgi:succinate-semialdehyde dehydrogenase/glutarate-semialdehyde dehydrogenase
MTSQIANPVSGLFIDGDWVVGSRLTRPVVDPATEQPVGEILCATVQDANDACEAAARAFRGWSREPAASRAAILKRAGQFLASRANEIANRLTLCQGKRLAEARAEVADAVELLEWSGSEARRLFGRIIPSPEAGVDLKVIRQPLGVVAVFTPWNFPIGEVATHCAAALAAGCTVVLKPAEETPWPALDFAAALQEAGLPDGALNVITGEPQETADALLSNKNIAVVAFTGSVGVGQHIASAAGRSLLPTVLELGGNAPVIVADDYDPVLAAKALFARKLRNAGQVCTSPSRFFVPEAHVSSFIDTMTAMAEAAVIGPGSDPATTLGPLANKRRMKAMVRFVEDARATGATVACGGRVARDRGYFWEPTVLTNISGHAAVAREEIFGPIIPVFAYRDIDEAVELANSVPVGLSGYAFTNNIGLRERLERDLHVGTLSFNHVVAQFIEAPFGGMKETGYGRVGGFEGVTAYTRTKLISTAIQRSGC